MALTCDDTIRSSYNILNNYIKKVVIKNHGLTFKVSINIIISTLNSTIYEPIAHS